MVMNICICDENLLAASSIKRLIEEKCHLPDLLVSIYENPHQLIDEMIENALSAPHLVLMDIALNSFNGITLAAHIQSLNPETKIVFISGYEKRYSQMIFDNVSPSGLIIKPVDPTILISAIHRIFLEVNQKQQQVTIKTSMGNITVSVNSILYIESFKRTLIYHINNDTYTVYDKLDCVENHLAPCFIRCHKSYIVNLGSIVKMDTDFLLICNGTKIPISKKYKEITREHYFKYKGFEYADKRTDISTE